MVNVFLLYLRSSRMIKIKLSKKIMLSQLQLAQKHPDSLHLFPFLHIPFSPTGRNFYVFTPRTGLKQSVNRVPAEIYPYGNLNSKTNKKRKSVTLLILHAESHARETERKKSVISSFIHYKFELSKSFNPVFARNLIPNITEKL